MSTTCLHCGNPMQSQRSTRKYCSDSCKQLAFYKRSGLALVSSDDGLSLSDTQGHQNEPADTEGSRSIQPCKPEFQEDLSTHPLNDKPSAAANNSFTVKLDQEEVHYEWVRSRIIDSIADHVDNSDALFMFQHPGQYWGAYVLPSIKWVSLRFRCLVESLIKLSNFSVVEYDNIIALKDAFAALINSNYFALLPANYPFTALIKEIEQKLALIAKQHEHCKSIRFRLSISRKVELIDVRFMLADFVAVVKFSEISFDR
jgi:hypothetical protein